MYYDEIGKCYVAESRLDFRGWEYLGKEKFKKGVYKVAIRLMTAQRPRFMIVFTSTKDLPRVKNGMCY